MASATDDFQEYHNPHNLVIATQQPMPRAEHQYSQRPIQLKDLKKYSRREEDQGPGCVSSFGRSAGGEFSLLWSWLDDFRDKRRRKKVDVARRKRKDLEDTGQRAREVLSNSNVASAASASTPEEPAGLPQTPPASYTHPSSIRPQNPRVAKPAYSVTPDSQYVMLRKPVFKYRDTQGAVPRHSARVTKPAVLRRSVHLVHTTSKNYRVPGEPSSPKIGTSSRVTRFGDFISQEALNIQPPQSSTPTLPAQETPVESVLPRQEYRGTRWAFNGASAPTSSNINLPNPDSEGQSLEKQVKREECSICGTPNSPGTHYGDQGLWLCTACRNPRSATEFPPRTTSTKPEQRRQRFESPTDANTRNASHESEVCGSCHISLPPVERDGILLCPWCCKQLTLIKSPGHGPSRDSPRLTLLNVRRQQSLVSINTQDAEEEWEHFDLDISHETRVMNSPPKHSHERTSKEERNHYNHWPGSGSELTPTPPLKDSIYLPKRAYSPAIRDSSIPSPPAKDPTRQPTPQTRKPPPQTIRTTNRDTFYPSTPTSTPPPAIPPRPTMTKIQAQRQERSRKGSSVYPPTPQFTASNFPYPPPPIPQNHVDIRRALRASSVYTVDGADQIPRLHTPNWQLRSPNRDTSFYGFWEVLFREDGTTFRDV